MNAAESIDCIFCDIVGGVTPADVVFENEYCVVIRDISPKARVHLVTIVKKHIESLREMGEEDVALLGAVLRTIVQAAEHEGVAESGYRVVTNVGRDSGQEVQHLHWHILGGENLGPLRC